MKKIITVAAETFDNDYTCECGNNSFSDGFFPCNTEGEQIEPIEGEWDGHYVCERCGTIILPVENPSK